VGIVVPIRQGSRRLPLKHLYPLGGKVMLEGMVERLKKSWFEVRLTIPERDFLYQEWAKWMGLSFSVGPEEDVLGRVDVASRGLDVVCLVFGDSPLMDWRSLEGMVEGMGGVDMVYSTGPSGFRARVITSKALQEWRRWVSEQNEHALSGLVDPPPIKVKRFNTPMSSVKFSLDTRGDLVFLDSLVKEVGWDGRLEDYLSKALDHHPHNGAIDSVGHDPVYPPPGAVAG